jgi:hypothetical protein
MMNKSILSIFLIAFLFASCQKQDNEGKVVMGYKPIYISNNLAFETEVRAPEKFTDPGKMYLYNQYIYITDFGNGVHIIDNSDPANPTKLKFIKIPGVIDVAVKNGHLYADNFTDIVSFNIGDLNNITLSKRLKDVYPRKDFYPETKSGYFDCVDTAKGYVIGWEQTELIDPKCYR